MRDAVGGTFMIKLLLIFLAVYTVFIAIAINYAKAFKVKNKVINKSNYYKQDISNFIYDLEVSKVNS